MSASRRVPLRVYPAQRIALIKPSALGDIVHSLPVLTVLRRRYPAAHITWVVNRSYEPLLQGHPDLNATLPVDRGAAQAGTAATIRSYGNLFRQLWQQRFDLVIDLQGLLRTGLMTWATRATRRIGLSSAREGSCWFYTDVVDGADTNTMHAVDRYWRVIETLDANPGSKQFNVPLSAAARRWAAEAITSRPRPWLMIGAGARWMTKRWPPTHFGMLARRALERFGGSVIFVGGADERPLARAVAERLPPGTLDLTGRTTLPQLAAVLARADVMIANDTGPLHLAAALGRPVVAPYTCTKVVRTGPYAQPGHGVEASIWCQGSYLKQCRRLDCMAELTPERLWPALEEVLVTWQRQRRPA